MNNPDTTVDEQEVLNFLGHAFRNIDLSPLSRDDLRDIAGGLARVKSDAISSLQKEIDAYRAALTSIAEGNLGPMAWQANYDCIREIASAALSNTGGAAALRSRANLNDKSGEGDNASV